MTQERDEQERPKTLVDRKDPSGGRGGEREGNGHLLAPFWPMPKKKKEGKKRPPKRRKFGGGPPAQRGRRDVILDSELIHFQEKKGLAKFCFDIGLKKVPRGKKTADAALYL